MAITRCTIFRGNGRIAPFIDIEWADPPVELPDGLIRSRSKLETDVAGEPETLGRWRVRGQVEQTPQGASRMTLQRESPGRPLNGEQATVRLALRGADDEVIETPISDVAPPGDNVVAAAADSIAGEGRRVAEAQERMADLHGDALGIARDALEDGRRVGDEVRHEWESFTAYPVQVAPAGPGGGPGPARMRSPVEEQLRVVVGRAKLDDVRSALAALDRTFTYDEEIERWDWQPHSYAGQSDIGAGVTGAQASLASYVQRLYDEIEAPAQALTPLRTARFNPGEVETRRSAFLASLRAFADELGADGGPRVARSRILLTQSLDQLGRFGVELGMVPRDASHDDHIPVTRINVLRREDEDQLTDFIVARDRLLAIASAFGRYVEVGEQDFGYDFVGLERNLDVLPELVDAVTDAMDSLGFGPDRRQNEPITNGDHGGDGDLPLTVEGLLRWIADFPDQEARPLLQDSGFRGVELIPPRTDAMERALRDLRSAIEDDGGPLPPSSPRSRVLAPLRALRAAVSRVGDAATEIADQRAEAVGAGEA
jgi:hypothetical protein